MKSVGESLDRATGLIVMSVWWGVGSEVPASESERRRKESQRTKSTRFESNEDEKKEKVDSLVKILLVQILLRLEIRHIRVSMISRSRRSIVLRSSQEQLNLPLKILVLRLKIRVVELKPLDILSSG